VTSSAPSSSAIWPPSQPPSTTPRPINHSLPVGHRSPRCQEALPEFPLLRRQVGSTPWTYGLKTGPATIETIRVCPVLGLAAAVWSAKCVAVRDGAAVLLLELLLSER
jgi:hypothetical protein